MEPNMSDTKDFFLCHSLAMICCNHLDYGCRPQFFDCMRTTLDAEDTRSEQQAGCSTGVHRQEALVPDTIPRSHRSTDRDHHRQLCTMTRRTAEDHLALWILNTTPVDTYRRPWEARKQTRYRPRASIQRCMFHRTISSSMAGNPTMCRMGSQATIMDTIILRPHPRLSSEAHHRQTCTTTTEVRLTQAHWEASPSVIFRRATSFHTWVTLAPDRLPWRLRAPPARRQALRASCTLRRHRHCVRRPHGRCCASGRCEWTRRRPRRAAAPTARCTSWWRTSHSTTSAAPRTMTTRATGRAVTASTRRSEPSTNSSTTSGKSLRFKQK